jgi:putative addiction module component (TIGR02574 family)
MTERTQQLIAEALKLPVAERAALIAEVAASMGDEDASFDPEWLAEIERRALEARRDRSGASLEEIERRIAERLRRE